MPLPLPVKYEYLCIWRMDCSCQKSCCGCGSCRTVPTIHCFGPESRLDWLLQSSSGTRHKVAGTMHYAPATRRQQFPCAALFCVITKPVLAKSAPLSPSLCPGPRCSALPPVRPDCSTGNNITDNQKCAVWTQLSQLPGEPGCRVGISEYFKVRSTAQDKVLISREMLHTPLI